MTMLPMLCVVVFLTFFVTQTDTYTEDASCYQWSRDNSVCACCRSGFKGEDCSTACPNCRSKFYKSVCHKYCKAGFHGDNCQEPCNENCSPGSDGFPHCDSGTGNCLGCVDGYNGVRCDRKCSERCVDGLCEKDLGTCLKCPNKTHGRLCEDCSSTCRKGLCHRWNGSCAAGCVRGRYGDYCNETCSDRCRYSVCEGRNGSVACTEGCEDGFKGLYCGAECPATCRRCGQYDGNCETAHSVGESAKTQIPSTSHCVDSDPASCNRGCKPGFYGVSCNMSCPEKCYSNGACSQITGECLTGCHKDWHKYNCSKECKGNCTGDVCDIVSGECIFGCREGFFGEFCDKPCSSSCVHGTCDEFGGCRCGSGVNDSVCYVECSDGCLGGECAIHEDGQVSCLRGCVAGRAGTYCQEFCPDNCQECHQNGTCKGVSVSKQGLAKRDVSDRCHRNSTVECVCCKDGWTGVNQSCNIRCPRCIYLYNPTNNRCDSKCSGGKYGTVCHLNCSLNCKKSVTNGESLCHIVTGKCDAGCLEGYYGYHCEKRCSRNCIASTCHYNGRCVSCIPRKYGVNCEEDCGRCVSGTCDRNGTCAKCQAGYFGLKCNHTCTEHCVSNDCRVDVRGNHVCAGECVKGYMGASCIYKCPPGCKEGCNRTEGFCRPPTNNSENGTVLTAIAALIGVLIVTVIVGIAVFVFIQKRRNHDQSRQTNKCCSCIRKLFQKGKQDKDGEGESPGQPAPPSLSVEVQDREEVAMLPINEDGEGGGNTQSSDDGGENRDDPNEPLASSAFVDIHPRQERSTYT